jgi:benzoylformate decarboxylase
MIPAAEALLTILRDEGVDRIFGNPGTTELPFIDALVDAPDLPYVLGLQEGSVVAMADGFARATRRPAFVNLHVAAGLANGLIGMFNALRSGTPMVITAGQQDRRHLAHGPMLAADLVALAGPAVKAAVEVASGRDLPLLLRRSFALAATPPTGPVFLSIPMDLLAEGIDIELPRRSARPAAGPAAGADEAAALLAAANRPAIVAGDGVGRDGAVAELVALAEALGAAVYHQPMADGLNFPATHPLYRGMPLPTTADIQRHLRPHDVVFIVGTRAFAAHHYTPEPPIPDGTLLVQLDADPTEPGRNFPVQVALCGGLAATLALLAKRVHGRVPDAVSRIARYAALSAADREHVDAAARAAYGAAPMDPLGAMHAIATALPGDAVVVEEAITAGLLLRRVLRLDRPGSYMHTVGGGLGWGIGAAIGTRLGAPDRPVVAVLGDGCATFGLQGLWTAAHHRVPVAFVVVNNGEYRTLKDTLDRNSGKSRQRGRYVGLDLRDPVLDWRGAGQMFGVPVVQPADCAALGNIIRTLPTMDGPLLIDVSVTGHTIPG